MRSIVLDGKSLALEIENELKKRVEQIKIERNQTPILATILVGNDPASAMYVKMKENACTRIGMEYIKIVLPATTTTQGVLTEIDKLNTNHKVNGILLQHPVPRQINERLCFDRIDIKKDVDGVTSHSFGRMALNEKAYGSATPLGIMRLLNYYKIQLEGKHAVIVGRSPILGKPMAMMLLNANATVTICHSKTQNIAKLIKQADIVVGAVGKPQFIKGAWIKKGAVVIDAGYHPGKIGDVKLNSVKDKCYAYTPVPGGVGPMTIITLITQTIESAEKNI